MQRVNHRRSRRLGFQRSFLTTKHTEDTENGFKETTGFVKRTGGDSKGGLFGERIGLGGEDGEGIEGSLGRCWQELIGDGNDRLK